MVGLSRVIINNDGNLEYSKQVTSISEFTHDESQSRIAGRWGFKTLKNVIF